MSCIIFECLTDIILLFFPCLVFLMSSIKNLKMNKHHYASWMVHLGGERLVLALNLAIHLILAKLHVWSLEFILGFKLVPYV